MDIEFNRNDKSYNVLGSITGANYLLRQSYGNGVGVTCGMLQGLHNMRLSIPEGSDIAIANAIGNYHDTLVTTSDKMTIVANGADTATITCNDSSISNDATVEYTVWLGSDIYALTADALVANGRVSLALAVNEPGDYLIGIRQKTSYKTGYITIKAV